MKERAAHLDMLRGCAALAVCAGHLRAHLFVDFAQLVSPYPIWSALYAATGLGHQAVMLFFVLSGFFVGGSVYELRRRGTWSWRSYAVRRLSRLWLVLIPALFLTLLWDQLGMRLADGAGYDGRYYHALLVGPRPDALLRHDWQDFVGNLSFLQTIVVPTYGTNGPLWSLANEFWYYVLFPLGLSCLRPKGAGEAALAALVLISLIAWLPRAVLWGGLIWMLGFASYLAVRTESARSVCKSRSFLGATTVLVLASLALGRRGHWLGDDLALGCAFAPWVAALAVRTPTLAAYRRLAEGLSEISYSLYLLHYPLLAFVSFVALDVRQYAPGPAPLAIFCTFLLGLVAYSAALWWLFERNTGRLQSWLSGHIG